MDKLFNIVLSGGGIKGISYVGVFSEMQERGLKIGNITGVSAGAAAGAFISAGYRADELKKIMEDFDFGKLEIAQIPHRIYAVKKYIEFANLRNGYRRDSSFEDFMNIPPMIDIRSDKELFDDLFDVRGEIFKNIIIYSKFGCFFDGDYFEDWIYRVLSQKGIYTFKDLRGGIVNKSNPKGYKMRMTAVDLKRARIIVLPDDLSFYGIDPDSFSVSKAVRMSTSIPFLFKPVELIKNEYGKKRKYYFVDGGVIDNFPIWLMESDVNNKSVVGFRLDGIPSNRYYDTRGWNGIFNFLEILKGLIGSVHDLGVPKYYHNPEYVSFIDSSNVSFLDFGLSFEEKLYLYNQGRNVAKEFFDRML